MAVVKVIPNGAGGFHRIHDDAYINRTPEEIQQTLHNINVIATEVAIELYQKQQKEKEK